jgi:hypothetical protein
MENFSLTFFDLPLSALSSKFRVFVDPKSFIKAFIVKPTAREK